MKVANDSEDREVAEILKDLGSRTTCAWCKHPLVATMPRTRLCRHCNRLRLGLKKLEADAEVMSRELGRLSSWLEYELMVQREMVESAKAEGCTYGDVATRALLPLDLEHELCFLGEHYVGKALFRGAATWLNDSFCGDHARFVLYLLSLFNREYLRKNRRRLARWSVLTRT